MSFYDSIPCRRQMEDMTMQQGQNGMSPPMYPYPVISPTGYPTGMPTGPTPVSNQPMAPSGSMPPTTSTMTSQPGPTSQTLSNPQYTAGFLRTMIGRRMRIDFLIGTNTLTDRVGTLVGVGTSYVLIRSEDTNEIIMGDLYSIKFATIYPSR